jgi:peptide/nickel transport system ATP-binding protein
MSDELLSVRDLSARIGHGDGAVWAVDSVSFDIKRGETFALLGESGCGKSMTALSVLRLLPSAGHIVGGEVILSGVDVLKLPENQMRRWRGGRIGMIFQEPMTSLNAVMTVGEQITETLRAHQRMSKSQRSSRVLELLTAVGIPDPKRRIYEYPHQLSGGMKQRVMIAIALAGNPNVLIADEPTTAVDVTIQAQILDLLKQTQRNIGMAILLITHDLGVVAEIADRVAVMYAGQIVEEAPLQLFYETPSHPYSRKLFASLPDIKKRGLRLSAIQGMVPRLNQGFEWCRFSSRCDYATTRCHTEVPRWYRVTPSHSVRCFLYDQTTETPLPEAPTVMDVGQEGVASSPRHAPYEPLLQATDLSVHFPIQKGVLKRVVGFVRAVDGVSLTIEQGETFALVGESGCGKTTLGKAILQLIRPTSGSVRFNDIELTRLNGRRLRCHRSDFQIIFQDPFSSMNPRIMIGDIIEEGMRTLGKNRSTMDRITRVELLLEQVGLSPDIRNQYPHEFSGGQRQRICIARALAVNPRLIVCDEPTSALDVSVQAQILNLLKELQEKLSLTYLFITHNISVVAYLAHKVAVMYLGRVVEQGTVDDVLNNSRHPYTQALLSAVPRIEPGTKKSIIRLQGDVPSVASPPAGCYFHPRCPRVSCICKEAYPDTITLSNTHTVNCYFAREGD